VPAEHSGVIARGVTVRVTDKLLLRAVDLDVAPGELCAVIGVSGCGKSTLLRVLAGVDSPTLGHVAVDGAPAVQRTHLVGYVPFGDLVHRQLTVHEALSYAAALRLPDASVVERAARVDAVIAELRMQAHAGGLVGSLSDGERRRVACGSELVGAPLALVLDEPTTGLDPDLQRRLMLFLRGLADRGLAVVLSTHATGSLDLCDQVAVMAPGGRLRFTGTQEEVLEHFGEQTIDDVYADVHTLAEEEPPEPRERGAEPADAELPPLPPLGAQVATLTSRYATCVRRQRRSLALLLGQAPVIGLAIALVLPSTAQRTVDLTPFYTLLIAFTVVIGAIWLGLITSCREIAGELAILRREAAVGVRLDAYLFSKCAVLLPIAAAQVVLLLLPLIVVGPLDLQPSAYLMALPVLVAASWVGSMLGLLISAFVRTPGQATTAVPVVMIPQLLFAGALIARSAMAPPMQLISDLMPSRWTLASVGTAFDLDERVRGNLGGITGLEPSFFAIQPVVGLAILAAASAVLFVLTTALLSVRLGDDSPGRLAATD